MATSCINFAIFGNTVIYKHNHRVLQTFLSTITQPNPTRPDPTNVIMVPELAVGQVNSLSESE